MEGGNSGRVQLHLTKRYVRSYGSPQSCLPVIGQLIPSNRPPDWGETYVPQAVGKLMTFRYLTSLAAGYGLTINHFDVVTAFVNPHVDDPGLYMEIANVWDSGDGDCDSGNGITAGAIVRLNKALYGPKQGL